MSNVQVCLITCPSRDVARQIAHTLVEERLVACVNIVDGVTSVYRWEGAVQEDAELLLIAKTTEEKLAALRERLPQLHPYSVPELLALRVDSGLPAYLQWVSDSVTAG